LTTASFYGIILPILVSKGLKMSGFSLTSLNNFYIKILETPTPPIFTSTHEEPLEARIWQVAKKIFLIIFISPTIFLIVRPILWAQRTLEVREAPPQEPAVTAPPELPPPSPVRQPPQPRLRVAPINPSLVAVAAPRGLPREGNTSFIGTTLQAIKDTPLADSIIAFESDNPGIIAIRDILIALRNGQFPSQGALERARLIHSDFKGSTECYNILFLSCLLHLTRGQPSNVADTSFDIDVTNSTPPQLESRIRDLQTQSPLPGTPDTLFFGINWVFPKDREKDLNACQLAVPLDLPSALLQTEAPYRLRSFVCLEVSEGAHKSVSYVRKTDASGNDTYFRIDGPQVTCLEGHAAFVQAARKANFVTYQTNYAAVVSD
jgi:hypothetical protein